MRVSFVHGAGVRDLSESLREVTSGLQKAASTAELPSPDEWLELRQVEYGKLLDEQPTPKAGRPSAREKSTAHVVEYATCSCCSPKLGYALYGAVLQSAGTPPSVAQWLIDWRFPDVAKYSQLSDARGKVISSVAQQLREQAPLGVIAHSLGTVVAVDALRELAPSDRPRLLITAGSPLAREGLFDNDPDWVPDSNMLWINILDVTDEVTGGVDLDSYRWTGAVNVRVNNDHYSRFWGPGGGLSATHHIEHYMTHPAALQALAFLARNPDAKKEDLRLHFLDRLTESRR